MWTFFLHHHIDIWMLVTLFKATNQPIGLCSTIYNLTVNGIKKCYFSLGADLLKGFHLLSSYLILECYKKMHSLYKCRFLHAQFAWLLIWLNTLILNTHKWERKDNFCVDPSESNVSPRTLREAGIHFWGGRLSLWITLYISLSSWMPMRTNPNNELLSDASRNECFWMLQGFGVSSWSQLCGTHHCWRRVRFWHKPPM